MFAPLMSTSPLFIHSTKPYANPQSHSIKSIFFPMVATPFPITSLVRQEKCIKMLSLHRAITRLIPRVPHPNTLQSLPQSHIRLLSTLPEHYQSENPTLAQTLWPKFRRTPPRRVPRHRLDGLPERYHQVRVDNFIPYSPRKARLVTTAINGLTVAEAERQLGGIRKKLVLYLLRRLGEAVEEAKGKGLDVGRCIVGCYVTKSTMRKTVVFLGKGNIGQEKKRYCKVFLRLIEVEEDMWEWKSRGNYVHMMRSGGRQKIVPPKGLIKPWEVRSQLDLTLKSIKKEASRLKEELKAEGVGVRTGEKMKS